MKEVNQSGEDFLHEAKVTIFVVMLKYRFQVLSLILDPAYQNSRSALRQINLETETFQFMRFEIAFILKKLKMIL